MNWRLRTGDDEIIYRGIPQLRRDDLDPDEYEVEYDNDDVTIKEARFRTSPDWADPIYVEEAGELGINNVIYTPCYSDDGILNYAGAGNGRRNKKVIEVPRDEDEDGVQDEDEE